jgi:hypothetical protein
MSKPWNIHVQTVSVDFLNLSDKDVVRCDCGRPVSMTPLTDDKARLNVCECGRLEEYNLPHCEMYGPKDGPWFFYVPKPTQSATSL